MMAAALAASLLIAGCGKSAPSVAQIEAVGMEAMQRHSLSAYGQLHAWAKQGSPVAQRELGMLLLQRDAASTKAINWLGQAAHNGDAEAAFQIGEQLRRQGKDMEHAYLWYGHAARGGHARAALMAGLMSRNGEGTQPDLAASVRWLDMATARGEAHAMYILSNMLRDGEGAARDPVRAHQLLEEAAERDYPAAIQDLAMQLDRGAPERSGHLMKEASEHRHNLWNTY
jgi:TPR repeat protein